MKKTAILTALLAAASLVTACGNDSDSGEKAVTTINVINVETTEETSAEEETTAPETIEVTETVTSANVTVTTEETTQSVVSDDTAYSRLAGYWFVDGDPTLASIHITDTGRFVTFYSGGNPEMTGFLTYGDSEQFKCRVYTFCSEQGETIMTFCDDNSLDDDTFYINESNTCYKRLFYEGGLGDDGRDPAEELLGSWECGGVILNIDELTADTYYVTATYYEDERTHTDWSYVCTFSEGKLVSDHCGNKCTIIDPDTPDEHPETIFGYIDGSAEFSLRGEYLIWSDESENYADDMRFVRR